MAGAFLVASLQTARLVARYGRTVITAGRCHPAGRPGLVIWALEQTWPHTSPWSLLPGFVVMGFGQGLTMPSLIRVVLSEVPLESAGAGSGVFTTMQQLCLARRRRRARHPVHLPVGRTSHSAPCTRRSLVLAIQVGDRRPRWSAGSRLLAALE